MIALHFNLDYRLILNRKPWQGGDSYMRIVTRPDFDGIVCGVLILEAENASTPVKWVSPGDMQRGNIDIRQGK